MTNVGGIAVFGATYPAHIWAAFMKAAHGQCCPPSISPARRGPVADGPTHRRVGRHHTIFAGPPRPRPPTSTGRPRRHRLRGPPTTVAARRADDSATTPATPPPLQRRRRLVPDMSADELEALLLVQEHDTARDRLRHRRAALPERAELEELGRTPYTLDAQARANAGGEKCWPTSAVSTTRRARSAPRPTKPTPSCIPARSAPPRAAGDAGRHRHAAPPSLRPRRRGARGHGEARGARQRSRDARRRNDVVAPSRPAARASSAARRGRDRRRARATEDAGAPEAAERYRNLVADYQRRRAQNKGAGAARLVGTSCGACHLSIPSTEAEQIRKAAGAIVAYCDNCGAILVP